MAGFTPYNTTGLLEATYKPASYLQGNNGVSTNAALGSNTLRLTALPIQRPITVVGLFGEFTVAGDVASLFTMLLYGDDGTGFPGQLLINGGSISTGTGNAGTIPTAGAPGVYAGAIAPQVLQPALYWIGGGAQGVTVTQPTMRTAQFGPNFAGAVGALPSANQNAQGYSAAGISGAPPNPFPAFGVASTVGAFPRIGLQLQ